MIEFGKLEYYLLVVNAIGALAYLINLLLYRHTANGRIDVIVTIVSLLGGSAGMLLMILLFDRKAEKENMMSRVFIICIFIIQVIMLLIFEGHHAEHFTFAFWKFFAEHRILLIYLGIMNLVNTMMNSIYTRRRELGMIQAIGMSEKQLIRMLQLEGIIYTLGTLAVSVGIGSLVGYGAFLYAKTKHIFQISEYHFPVVPAVLLICVVAFLQVLLTYGVSANFRKLSLIDRIRYAE